MFGLMAILIVLMKGCSIGGVLTTSDLFNMTVGAGIYLTSLGAFLVNIGGFLHS
jgi:hypothetical protein